MYPWEQDKQRNEKNIKTNSDFFVADCLFLFHRILFGGFCLDFFFPFNINLELGNNENEEFSLRSYWTVWQKMQSGVWVIFSLRQYWWSASSEHVIPCKSSSLRGQEVESACRTRISAFLKPTLLFLQKENNVTAGSKINEWREKETDGKAFLVLIMGASRNATCSVNHHLLTYICFILGENKETLCFLQFKSK